MAKGKKTTQILRLVSMAGTGFFYTIRKSVKLTEKCDPPATLAAPAVTERTGRPRPCARIVADTPTEVVTPACAVGLLRTVSG